MLGRLCSILPSLTGRPSAACWPLRSRSVSRWDVRPLCSPSVAALATDEIRVSNLGRIELSSGRITHGYLRVDGYRQIIIQHNSRRRSVLAHRLVGFAWLPNERGNIVSHLDGVLYNNNAANLSVSARAAPRGNGRGRSVLVRSHGKNEDWCQYPSVQAASQATGISSCAIFKALAQERVLCKSYEIMPASGADPSIRFQRKREKWVPMLHPQTGCAIPDWEISSCGRVKDSYGRVSFGRILPDGYHCVYPTLSHGSKVKLRVHHLVASHFCPPAPNDFEVWQVNHKDLDRGNNCADNLEYCTAAQNMQHSYTANPDRRTCREALSKPVLGRKVGSHNWVKFPSIKDAAVYAGCSRTSVTNCCNGTVPFLKHCNMEFRFDESCLIPSTLEGEEWNVIKVGDFFRWNDAKL